MTNNALTVNENDDEVMNAKQGTILIAAQMAGLLERLDEATFTRPLPLFHGSTIGQHFRHILEFYTCLFDGTLPAHVDYSSRKRNPALSEKPRVALTMLDYIADTVKLVKFHVAGYLPCAFTLNYPDFPGSCPSYQFFGNENVLQVFVHRADIHPEQFGHFLLAQPKSLGIINDLHLHLPVGRGVEEEVVELREVGHGSSI